MADATDSQPSFFARLKQHHLYGVVVAYAVVAGFLIQLASRVLPAFGWGGALPAFIIILTAGFPVALVLAWTLVKPKDPAKYTRWQKLHWKLNASVSLVVIAAAVISSLYAWRLDQRYAARALAARAARLTPNATLSSFNPPADTLVVLPLTYLGGDQSQRYFSDGITEELTNVLGQTTGLRVIAWDTAAHYRDSRHNATDIGKALNVANVLSGRIMRQGDTVRVIVELVNTITGYQTWSAHYDDSLANVFQVQDTICQAIAQALQVKFASLGAAHPVNPEAHDLVLKAHALMNAASTAPPIEQAVKLLEQAIALDPSYAEAHAQLANAWFALTQYTTLSLKDALPKVRAEANKALILDPRNVKALVVLANADASEGKIAAAKAGYERALAIDPSNVAAHVDYANVLPLKQSLAQTLEAVQLDPEYGIEQNNLAATYMDLGEYQLALAPWQAVMRLDPKSADSALSLALTYALLHRNEEAVKAFDLAKPDTPLAKALVAAGRLTYQSVLDPKLRARALRAVDKLRKRPDLDPTSTSDLIQLYLALGQNHTALQLLPQNCAAQPFGCNDLSINPMYLPLRNEPRFKALVQKYDTVSKPPPTATSP